MVGGGGVGERVDGARWRWRGKRWLCYEGGRSQDLQAGEAGNSRRNLNNELAHFGKMLGMLPASGDIGEIGLISMKQGVH